MRIELTTSAPVCDKRPVQVYQFPPRLSIPLRRTLQQAGSGRIAGLVGHHLRWSSFFCRSFLPERTSRLVATCDPTRLLEQQDGGVERMSAQRVRLAAKVQPGRLDLLLTNAHYHKNGVTHETFWLVLGFVTTSLVRFQQAVFLCRMDIHVRRMAGKCGRSKRCHASKSFVDGTLSGEDSDMNVQAIKIATFALNKLGREFKR